MDISKMNTTEIANQIELMAKEIKARESGIPCTDVFYDSARKFYIKTKYCQLVRIDGLVTCVHNNYKLSEIPCKWIETTRENIKIGDIVNFAEKRTMIKFNNTNIITNIEDNKFECQFIDYGGLVQGSREYYLKTDLYSFKDKVCFIARTEDKINDTREHSSLVS